jgi:hypothetical protein
MRREEKRRVGAMFLLRYLRSLLRHYEEGFWLVMLAILNSVPAARALGRRMGVLSLAESRAASMVRLSSPFVPSVFCARLLCSPSVLAFLALLAFSARLLCSPSVLAFCSSVLAFCARLLCLASAHLLCSLSVLISVLAFWHGRSVLSHFGKRVPAGCRRRHRKSHSFFR